jgi:bifunctional N6-L-threonylcarbamoyladenine synthase / protein kinase Bud32
MSEYVLAFDTANEMISLGLGRLRPETKSIECVASHEVEAFRASNVKLLPEVDSLLARAGVARNQVACVVCGRGPGSFTGVRICMASAKGLAIGLSVPLFGVSTSDAQAWQQWQKGVRGTVVVLGDAMRKEVYPVRYSVTDEGVERLNSDMVMKAALLPEWLGSEEAALICGDALKKYSDLCEGHGVVAGEADRYPTGVGLLLAAQAAWAQGAFDPVNLALGDPCALLPVYTRLSDAEEHERIKFAKQSEEPQQLDAKDLQSGVQGGSVIRYQPLEAVWAPAVAALEQQVMGTDAWNAAQILDELPRADRTWWAAYEVQDTRKRTVNVGEATLVGYAGGWINDGQVQLLKIASSPEHRRQGIAQELLTRVALDARDLGAKEMTLEVRASNAGAHAFYERLGLRSIGKRPHYYSDKEDACIYAGPLPVSERDVAGMELRLNDAAQSAQGAGERIQVQGRLILAIESSCDETACALIDEAGTIISDVVASQIDFHSRFGGVVPEIASRKHIEAIGGVVIECLAQARERTGNPNLTWEDLGAVAVTYAPGLVGALVVGLAFAKGLAWACDVPLVGVNHLEGHLYANKIACPNIQPPMVVSLVSGGHTMLVHVKDWGNYETMGSTLDDAVGEAFDKVAKAMGLGYPGGPLISALAEKGNPKSVRFPRALMHSGDLQFSLSGLKTSVMTYLQKEQQAGREVNQADVAASFQAAVIDVQVSKARTALRQTGAKEFCLGGGVAANPELRRAYEELCKNLGVRLTMPPLSACTDNAAMIALVALDRYKQQKFFPLTCDVKAHAPLDEEY